MEFSQEEDGPMSQVHSSENGGGVVLDAAALDALAELGGEGSDFVQEVVSLFLTEAVMRVTEIREGLDRSEYERVLQAAHALKSSSASVGAVEFARCCGELEAHCRSGEDSEKVRPTGARAVAMYAEVQEALTALLRES